MKRYFKTDTGRWGTENEKPFYDLVIRESIAFCSSNFKYNPPQDGDIFAITIGYKVKALGVVKSQLRPITSPEFQHLSSEVSEFGIDFAPENLVVKLAIQELDSANTFSYQNRQGICEIHQKDIIEEINHCLSSTMKIDLIKRLKNSFNLILTGAPGTGKTYLARKIAEEFAGKGRWRQVQFHPSYDYTDFVEGLRPKNDRNGQIVFERKDGIFKEFCKTALDDKEHSFVFIIDEINRGDISKIFGELFYSIDPGYRGEQGKVETQYQNLINKNGNDIFKDGFYVPENVYILGTMNDIDRSVESMDFAIRRRFCWYEIKAEDTADSILSKLDPDIRETAKIKMTHMNEVIENTEGLSCAHHIGASYFLNLGKDRSCEGNFDNLWDYHLKPLIAEYLRGQRNAETKLNTIKKAYDGDESQD